MNATREHRPTEDVIELAESADVPGLYERAKSAAIQRGHGEQTAFAGIGGLLGGVLGSFRGPFGAAVGALFGALLGAFVGRERDRRGREPQIRPVRRQPPGVRIARHVR